MAEYYLIAQLPSLDGIGENTALPITEERFMELCGQLLGEKERRVLAGLTLLPPKNHERSGSALIEAWNEGERNLRFALGKARAEKMKKMFDAQNRSFSPELIKAANTAVEMENPLEAEKFLNRYRLDFLETLRPIDTFSKDFVCYYGLRLKLLARLMKFDTEIGESAYRNIYNSILDGEGSEAET